MAKEFKVGDKCYLPVEITDTNFGRDFPVQFRYFDGEDHYTESVAYKEGVLLTAEDVVSKYKTKADAMEVVSDSLQEENEELRAKLVEFKETIGKQSDKLRELQARIVELNEVNSSLGENRDALNNEAAVHMTSIHNLQVAVEVLAEKIFEMRCEQDG